MATRFYYSSTGVAAVSPDFAAEWDDTTIFDPIGNALRRELTNPRGASSFATITVAEDAGQTANELDHLFVQFVSAPLAAQTIAGTAKGRIRASESGAAANARSQCVIRVVSNDGTTVRGTLYAGDTAALASEWATSLTNRQMPRGTSVNLSSVDAQLGDRIVVEIGGRMHNTVTNQFGTTLRIGEAGAGDLPEDETDTNDLNPWIEFSQTLRFARATKAGLRYALGGGLRQKTLGRQA